VALFVTYVLFMSFWSHYHRQH